MVPFSEPIWMTERSGDLSRYFGTDLETAASQIAHMMDMGYAMQERFITNGVVGLLANSQDDRIFRITLDRDGPYLDLFEPTEYWYEIAGIHLGMTAERAKRVLEQAGYPIVEEQTDPVQGMYVYAFTEDSYLRFRVEQTEGQQTVISVSLEKREVQ